MPHALKPAVKFMFFAFSSLHNSFTNFGITLLGIGCLVRADLCQLATTHLYIFFAGPNTPTSNGFNK